MSQDKRDIPKPPFDRFPWIILLLMYIFLLSGSGYIAFWNQDFNDANEFLSHYETLRGKHIENLKNTYIDLNLSIEKDVKDNEFNELINQSMESAINSAGDLQELASQSFNIILGAVLAFLSATATMLFQNKSSN